ncbi:MAG TPA: GntR family transcriptional regulator [Actinomycetota bacterium]|nr:GntR family transcriptional regulator [Actinomycetota bacterium]
MILRVEPESPVPPYEQIRSQIATMASSGVIKAESRLPSIRQLASDLGLAGGTIARAYRELEREGVITTRGRHGTFVEKVSPRTSIDRELQAAARSFVVRATQLGADATQGVASVQRAFESATASS